jgi:hypothetical protein
MPSEVYRDRAWLYQKYVVERLTLTRIQKLLKERHGITISTQALYNWCKKHDLLKYRGKGRKLKMHNPTGINMGISPVQKQVNAIRVRKRALAKRRSGR